MNHSLLCKLIGCKLDHDCPDVCRRCGAHYYHDGHDSGVLRRLLCRIIDEIAIGVDRVIGRKCSTCGKRFKPKTSYDPCCSEACYQEWIPF